METTPTMPLRPVILALLLALPLPPADRLAYMRAVTGPLFACDGASAPVQLTLCPDAAHRIAHTRIPRQFHGPVRRLAVQLRTTSARCAWEIQGAALHFLRTSDGGSVTVAQCEGRVADLVTAFYAAR